MEWNKIPHQNFDPQLLTQPFSKRFFLHFCSNLAFSLKKKSMIKTSFFGLCLTEKKKGGKTLFAFPSKEN